MLDVDVVLLVDEVVPRMGTIDVDGSVSSDALLLEDELLTW